MYAGYTFHVSTKDIINSFLQGTTVPAPPPPPQTTTVPSTLESATDSLIATASLNPSNKSFIVTISLTPLVNAIRFSSLCVYFLSSYLLNVYLSFLARPLIVLIEKDLFPYMNSKTEHCIGFRIALCQLVIVLVLSAIFQTLLFVHYNEMAYARWFENIVNLYSLSSPVTLIAYVNYCCGHLIYSSCSPNKSYAECSNGFVLETI